MISLNIEKTFGFISKEKVFAYEAEVKAALSELALKDENDKALEKKNKSLNPKKSKKEDDWDDEDDDLDDDK